MGGDECFSRDRVRAIAVQICKEMFWAGASSEGVQGIARYVLRMLNEGNMGVENEFKETFPCGDPELVKSAMRFILENFIEVQWFVAMCFINIDPSQAIAAGFEDRLKEALENGYEGPDLNDGGSVV